MIFDHIGVFVRDIDDGKSKLDALLPIERWSETFDDPLIKVRVAFGTDSSGIRYELVAPFGEPNPVSGALAAGRDILNHVAYRVADLDAAIPLLRAARAMPLGPPQPAVAFGGARVMFFLTPLKLIVELIEERPAS
jgi:methylmalonyl-CoA/ethylmalonyl-CoA epimerase